MRPRNMLAERSANILKEVGQPPYTPKLQEEYTVAPFVDQYGVHFEDQRPLSSLEERG